MRSPRDLLGRDPVEIAPLLLGARLVSGLHPASDGVAVPGSGGSGQEAGRVVLRISEVEAYRGIGEDPGSHAHRRRTVRNGSMFGPPGSAYVYLSYGMHWCLNVVSHGPGLAGAVLVRAGEVVEGIELASLRRPAARADRDLARGPARLCAALGVDGTVDGCDLLDLGPLSLQLAVAPERYLVTTRTGVSGEGAVALWRFAIPGDPTVSPHRPVLRRS